MMSSRNYKTFFGDKRGLLRLLFGQLQIIGATAGLYLLLTDGVNKRTIAIVFLTGVISITSRLLFRAGGERK